MTQKPKQKIIKLFIYLKFVFKDEASVIGRKVQKYQLLTSVSIPIFDQHGNLRPNEVTYTLNFQTVNLIIFFNNKTESIC